MCLGEDSAHFQCEINYECLHWLHYEEWEYLGEGVGVGGGGGGGGESLLLTCALAKAEQ